MLTIIENMVANRYGLEHTITIMVYRATEILHRLAGHSLDY